MARNTSRSETGYSGLISILGLVTLLIGLILTVLLSQIRVAGWLIMALGVLLLGVAFIIDYRRVGKAITGKRGLFSAGTTVMVSIFIGITLLINAISINTYGRFDVTGLSQFTLTSQTKDVLNQLEDELTITIFMIPGDPLGGAINTFVEEYKNYSELVKLETIDPEEHPDQARLFEVSIAPAVVFQSQGRTTVVPPQDIFMQSPDGQISSEMEHPFTSAILQVSGIVQKQLYFLTGHGETDLNQAYGAAAQGLQDNLYSIGLLNFDQYPGIPPDATALIIVGPQSPLTIAETKIISDYLDDRGWLMILLNPNSPPEWGKLLEDWGVDVQSGSLIDPASYVSPSLDSPLVPKARNMMEFAETYFPGATAIIPREDASEFLMVQPLFFTSQESWLEEDFNPAATPEFDDGIDTEGPLAIGVLIAGVGRDEVPTGTPADEEMTRIVLVGDSDFATNQHFLKGDNGNLFLNLVELLTAGEELIKIERKVLPFRRLVVDQQTANFINISSIALLPILVLLVGGVIWWRRR